MEASAEERVTAGAPAFPRLRAALLLFRLSPEGYAPQSDHSELEPDLLGVGGEAVGLAVGIFDQQPGAADAEAQLGVPLRWP